MSKPHKVIKIKYIRGTWMHASIASVSLVFMFYPLVMDNLGTPFSDSLENNWWTVAPLAILLGAVLIYGQGIILMNCGPTISSFFFPILISVIFIFLFYFCSLQFWHVFNVTFVSWCFAVLKHNFCGNETVCMHVRVSLLYKFIHGIYICILLSVSSSEKMCFEKYVAHFVCKQHKKLSFVVHFTDSVQVHFKI